MTSFDQMLSNDRRESKMKQPTMTICLLFFLMLPSTILGQDTTSVTSCFSNPSVCLEELKQRLANTSYYELPETPSGVGSSVLGRFYGWDDSQDSVVNNLVEQLQNAELANVTFNAPAGSFFACDHMYSVPALVDHLMEPLQISPANQWSLRHTPEITWSYDDVSTLYTVIVYDSGARHLSAMYINAVGGNLEDALVVTESNDPLNPFFYKENPTLVVVLRQNATLSQSLVEQALASTHTALDNLFDVNTFRSDLREENGDEETLVFPPSHVSLISSIGGPYAAEYWKNKYMSNLCSLIISQEEVLYNGLNRAGFSPAWSYDPALNETSWDPLFGAPYITTLEVDIQLEFITDDTEFESCCTSYNYIKSMLRPDPIGNIPEYAVSLRSQPRVTLSNIFLRNGPDDFPDLLSENLYTFMMVDLGANDFSAPGASRVILHWLVTDITEGDVTSGTTHKEFHGPTPVFGDSRIYTFLVFEQASRLTANYTDLITLATAAAIFPCVNTMVDVCLYNLTELTQAWGLSEIKGVNWLLAKQDPYARQGIVARNPSLEPEAFVCGAIEGYADPCPASGGVVSTSLSLFHVTSILLLMMLMFWF